MVAALGQERVERLIAAGVLHAVAIRPHERVACPACRWHAQVIREPGGAVLVCEEEMCGHTLELGPAPYRLSADPGELARRVAEALTLDGTPGAGEMVVPLGRRRLGEEIVAFDLCVRVGSRGFEDALYRLARGGPRVRVLLVPCSSRIPADALSEIAGVELVWIGLDEVLVVERGFRADLRALLARRTFPGFSLELPFDGLAIEPGGVSWRGDAVTLKPRALRLLRALARHHPDVVTRAQLWREVFPEEHTRTGDVARGVNPDGLDSRLRQAVAEVRAALGDDVVANARGGERAGGYRLALPEGLLSRPVPG
jgi:hypothetical protein